MNRQLFYTVGLVVILLAIGLNTTIGLLANSRAGRGETLTCQIQDRGLEASPHLTRIVQDIGAVLTPYSGEKKAILPPFLVASLADLREEAGAYVAIEKKQPPGRKC
jgi:hypothetical protein